MKTLCEIIFAIMLISARIDNVGVREFFDRHKIIGYGIMIIVAIGLTCIMMNMNMIDK